MARRLTGESTFPARCYVKSESANLSRKRRFQSQTHAFLLRKLWPISAGQGPPRGLVRTHANNWSSRMQMAGQWQCKRVIKRNAIRQSHCSAVFFLLRIDGCTPSKPSESTLALACLRQLPCQSNRDTWPKSDATTQRLLRCGFLTNRITQPVPHERVV